MTHQYLFGHPGNMVTTIVHMNEEFENLAFSAQSHCPLWVKQNHVGMMEGTLNLLTL